MKGEPECQHPRILGGPNCDCMRMIVDQPNEQPVPIFLQISRATNERQALDTLNQTANERKENRPGRDQAHAE